MKINHDDFCPCTRFRAQSEFCSCGAIERDEIVKAVSESFAKRLNGIMRSPSDRSAPSIGSTPRIDRTSDGARK